MHLPKEGNFFGAFMTPLWFVLNQTKPPTPLIHPRTLTYLKLWSLSTKPEGQNPKYVHAYIYIYIYIYICMYMWTNFARHIYMKIFIYI